MKRRKTGINYEFVSGKGIMKNVRNNSNRENIVQNSIFELIKLSKSCSLWELKELINSVSSELKKDYGIKSALDFIYRLELSLKIRKPKLAIYDHAFHFIGGAQKYGLSMTKALENIFEITIITNKRVTHEDFIKWYNLDLSGMDIKTIPIPYFEQNGSFHIEPHKITKKMKNPFHLISRESGKYDIFINNGMLEMVYPLSPVSIMVCHFPERRPQSYFYSDYYTYTVYNSKYTGKWIQKRWKYNPHKHIYPPVDMSPGKIKLQKENIILSVARFEEGGTKKQYEMVRLFFILKERYPSESKGWKLILAGGSSDNNRYLEKIKSLVDENPQYPIELKVNIMENELKEIYKKAKIFWHLCGIGQNDPAKVEHFGMTIAEAMQNGVIPIVYDGGGQKEIVKTGISGFRIKSLNGLIKNTVSIMTDKTSMEKIRKEAVTQSEQFDVKNFNNRVKEFFTDILKTFI